jgi:endoglucanase
MRLKKQLLSIPILLLAISTFSQNFLHTQGTEIVNDNGPVILRSIGTGNWMIMEGYMMQSSSAGVSTHTEYREKLEATMGAQRTDEFFDAWTENHFSKTDLDSMKVWGFNAIRAALHYKTLTLPIEDEPRNSDGSLQNTWLEEGFKKIDALLSWCEQNEMYLILDMHGAPGGQGKNAPISDYDENLPSLWESEDNKQKLITLWTMLAERYKDSEWIGGFDMINEPNWSLDGSKNKNGCDCENNDDIWDLHERIIKEIRTVNTNHIVYISGNCWGGNYKSFEKHSLKNADDNLVITFHKYWNNNRADAIDKWLEMRETYHLPLWMSEGGENSNTWFSDCIALYENNNIGWSWWPVKKSKINNVLKVTTDDNYRELIKSWKNNTPLSADQTYKAVMQYANNHKIENCAVAKDVIYAMTEQVKTNQTKPFNQHQLNIPIWFADYDMGRDGYAYYDIVSADYHSDDGSDWAIWNSGLYYRNDGVDIGNFNNTPYVGWTEAGEWMQYTLEIPEAGKYTMKINSSANDAGGELKIEINGQILKDKITLPTTGEPYKWQSMNIKGILLPKGEVIMRIHIEKEGSNLLDFSLNKEGG